MVEVVAKVEHRYDEKLMDCWKTWSLVLYPDMEFPGPSRNLQVRKWWVVDSRDVEV